jgi:flavin-binding protein dodecin
MPAFGPAEDRIISDQTEPAQDPASVRVVESVGVSTRSREDAVRQAVARQATSSGHFTDVELIGSTAVVLNGAIAEYHADVKVAFIAEPALVRD